MSALTDDTLPVTPRAMRDEMIVFAAMAVLLAMVPLTGIYPFFVMQALCFALLACAFNLLIGYGGLLSFGHAMFLGTAGYFTAHALKVWGVSPELGILIGTVGAAALAVITGFALGVIEGLTKYFYPEASNTVVFVLMVLVLLVKPAGLTGRAA